MSTNAAQPTQLTSRYLIGALLAAGILWLLALSTASDAGTYHQTERKGISASYDMPLHVNGEHFSNAKRYFKRTKIQPQFSELPEPTWALHLVALVELPLLIGGNFYQTVFLAPPVRLPHLQQLNTPRAPPFI